MKHLKKTHVLMGSLVSLVMALSGCAGKKMTYSPDQFINPNRVVTEKVPVHVVKPQVNASFGYGNDPRVLKAYEQFTKHGRAKNIRSSGFITFAYSAYAHPVIDCSPMHLCVIQLERGERINNIALGDGAHWLVSTALVGSQNDGSYQIAVKPKVFGIATDMVVTTNRRTYNLGLVSKEDAHTHVVNFYYPEDTLNQAVQQAKDDENAPLEENTVSSSPHIDLAQVNFNYQLSGAHPVWRPSRVFDDGVKTFIQMTPISERVDLPVLYIVRNGKMQLINYRYKRPYYIVDGLFSKAFLVSGKGKHQTRVAIKNKNFS